MRKLVLAFIIEIIIISVGVVMQTVIDSTPVWVWFIVIGLCVIAATLLYLPEIIASIKSQCSKSGSANPAPTKQKVDNFEADQFRDLYPIIRRHADACNPNVIQALLNASPLTRPPDAQFEIDRKMLTRNLSLLKIQHPPRDAGNYEWHECLVEIGSYAELGEVEAARHCFVYLNFELKLPDPMPPTADK